MALEIHQDRGVRPPFAHTPIVDTEDPRRPSIRERQFPDRSSQGVAAYLDAQFPEQPGTGNATDGDAKDQHDGREARGPPAMRCRHAGQPLGEDVAGAAGFVTEPAAGVQVQADGESLPGEIEEFTGVPAVDTVRWVTTVRTAHRWTRRTDNECDAVCRRNDLLDGKNGRVGEEGG
jgi:hypothetical protein